MPKLTVNGVEVEVEAGATVLQACEEAGVEIPRFMNGCLSLVIAACVLLIWNARPSRLHPVQCLLVTGW